jgi:hypothetical protein
MSDLTSITNVEAWLGLAPGNSDEATLERLITAVSNATESYCSRTFAETDYTETRDGSGGYRLTFRNTPVTAVSSVTIDGDAVMPSPGAPQSGYLFSDTALTLIGQKFCRGLMNVFIAYTAGYATTPGDLEQAVIDWIAHVYREKDRIGFTSQNLAGQVTSYLIRDMPPRVATLLAPYKRRVPV